MGQKRPPKRKDPLYGGTRDDRSNLVIAHDRNLAQAITYSHTVMSILVLGATIFAFLYLTLGKAIGLGVFFLFVILAARGSYLSWRYHIKAQFIEEELGGPHTWLKYKLDKKLGDFRSKKRYYLFLDKIFRKLNKILARKIRS